LIETSSGTRPTKIELRTHSMSLRSVSEVYRARCGLYTKLLLPILYGVYHTNRRSDRELYIVQ